MHPRAVHVLLELYGCQPALLDDPAFVERALVAAAEAAGATVLARSFHRFQPQGVTGVVLIAESHLSVHAWPEAGYAAIDVFTCGERAMPDKAAEALMTAFKPASWERRDIERGRGAGEMMADVGGGAGYGSP